MDAAATLMGLLEGLDDPREARGKRHPLPALLGLAVVAMLAGPTGYEAILQYGKERGWPFLQALGFTRRRGLCKAPYSRVFRRIDVAAFEAAVAGWVRDRLGPGDARHLALDGKSLRGSREGRTPAAHLVAAYAPDVEAVVGQIRVDAQTNEHKAALELLGVLPLRGRVVTADARCSPIVTCVPRSRAGAGTTSYRPRTTGRPDPAGGHPEGLRRAASRPFPPVRRRGGRRASSGRVSPTRGTAASRSARWR